MTVANLRVAGKDYVLLPKRDFDRLAKDKQHAHTHRRMPPVEVYSEERIASFMLSNAVGVEDYAEACEDVRRMGLDPTQIKHRKPAGVR